MLSNDILFWLKELNIGDEVTINHPVCIISGEVVKYKGTTYNVLSINNKLKVIHLVNKEYKHEVYSLDDKSFNKYKHEVVSYKNIRKEKLNKILNNINK